MSANEETSPTERANPATEGQGPRKSGYGSKEDFEVRRIVASLERSLLGRGELIRIGVYEVREFLGEGGMGVVYRCHHDNLRRDVAIKLVKSQARANERARLLREAQALARLSHENVVKVYDWGEHEGRAYIVMEFVEGQTMRDRIAALGPLSWRELVHEFIDAGRGLAAAHAHGLVHRDFKPENVLVSTDGRVCVADFGLALAGPTSRESERDEATRGSTHEQVTASGSIAGTRAYMSPEQLRGQHVDERSDQYSFCVALYEALWERYPFPGATESQRAQARQEGRIVVPPDKRALFRVLARGLSPEPAHRWPSMEALLDRLGAISTRGSRWRRGLGFAAAACSLFTLGTFLSQPQANTCESPPSPWNPQTREVVELRSLAEPELAGAWASLDAGLTRWSDRWTQRRHELCERDDSSKNACLENQRVWVDNIVEALSKADPRALALLVDVVDELPNPEACIEAATIQPGEVSPRAQDTWRKASEAHIRRLLGYHEEARVFAREAELEAKALDDPKLLAVSLGQLAKAEQEGGSIREALDLYEASAEEARAAGLWPLATDLELQRLELLISRHEPLDGIAAELERLAEGVDGRGHAPLEAHVEFLRGRIAARRGNATEANAHYDRALSLVGEHSLAVPAYWSAKASVAASERDKLQLSARARDEALARFGAMHPRTARYIYNYGLALGTEEGERERRRAEMIWGSSPQGPLAYLALSALAERELVEGDLDAAMHWATQALARFEETHPSQGADYAELLQLHAKIEAAAGNLERAMGLAEEAVHAYLDGAPSGELGPQALECCLILIDIALLLERHDDAAAAIDELFARHGEDPLVRERVGLRRAELDFRRGDFLAARDRLAEIDAVTADHPLRALSVELLRLLVDLRLGHVSASAIARFHEQLAAARGPGVREALQAWLDQLPVSPTEREQVQM